MEFSKFLKICILILFSGCLYFGKPVVTADILEEKCDSFRYSVLVTTEDGQPLPEKEVLIYFNNVLKDKVKTDVNGRAEYSLDLPCIMSNLVFSVDDVNYTVRTDLRRTIQINVSYDVLMEGRRSNITVSTFPHTKGDLYFEDQKVSGTIEYTPGKSGKIPVKIMFSGDTFYKPKSEIIYLDVLPPQCEGGVKVGECSDSYYCNNDLKLSFDCNKCGCSKGTCYNNACLDGEDLYLELLTTTVSITTSYSLGSGVIVEHNNGQTVILTNKHVIETADSVYDVKVTFPSIFGPTYSRTFPASRILVVPRNVDLALIYVDGVYGEPAHYEFSIPKVGEEVFVLGNPSGLETSLTKGIISGLRTDGSVSYIQIDAPVNPGNSGGGLYSAKNGNLIGIVTSKLVDVNIENIGFAIDITEYIFALSWEPFTPVPKCSDGTPVGSCSPSGYYCNYAQILEENCYFCGCPDGYACYEGGQCLMDCGYGYDLWEGDNYFFCCPIGWTGYEDEFGEPFCCPPGEIC